MWNKDGSANRRKKEVPYCYGKIENVFPEGEDGLRHTPESCMPCLYRTDCLRFAMQQTTEGLKVREEKVDRAYSAGMMGFLERWSQKKQLHRRIQQKKKDEDKARRQS
jgi:hypothetical protein